VLWHVLDVKNRHVVHVHTMKTWSIGDTALFILIFDNTRERLVSRSGRFKCRARIRGIHSAGGWIHTGAVLDTCENRKNFPLVRSRTTNSVFSNPSYSHYID
jgi:hypothetical protein